MLLLDSSARPVIAHRGDRAHAPENTIEAFARALAANADAIECDVRLSADGEVVVMHDPTVDRTTDGTGAIAELPLAAIREFNAGARWAPHDDPERANGGVRGAPTPFATQLLRVPLFEEVLEAFPRTPFLVECKTVSVASRTAEVVHARGASTRVLIGAFSGAALAVARSAGLSTIASQAELLALLPAILLGRRARQPSAFQAIAIPPARYRLPLPIGGYARAAGVPVHIWTVNDTDEANRFWRAGARGIVTDNPARMVEARANRRG
jgi:glycerophosphoryl diester phosphodiesterase